MLTKTFYVLISACLLISLNLIPVVSADMLAWDSSDDQVDGYIVYYGTSQTNMSQSVDVGNVTAYDLDNLPLSESVQYYLSVTAYNATGESPPAGPIGYTLADQTPPSPPEGLEALTQN